MLASTSRESIEICGHEFSRVCKLQQVQKPETPHKSLPTISEAFTIRNNGTVGLECHASLTAGTVTVKAKA